MEMVPITDPIVLAQKFVTLTCDLVSELDLNNVSRVTYGACTFPEFSWIWFLKKRIMKRKLEDLKEKLLATVPDNKWNDQNPGVPYNIMKMCGYSDEDLEYLISLAMMAKPSVFIPRKIERPLNPDVNKELDHFNQNVLIALTFSDAQHILLCFCTFTQIKREIGACRI